MDSKSKKDELKVERYDDIAAELKRKKLKKIAIGVGVAAVLGYFGLIAGQAVVEEIEDRRDAMILGGAGAWFESEVLFPEDSDG